MDQAKQGRTNEAAELVITSVYPARRPIAGIKLGSVMESLVLGRVPDDLQAALKTIPRLGDRLRSLYAEGRVKWPGLEVVPELFAAFLADRLDAEHGEQVLDSIHAADLYVACACCAGSAKAKSLLEEAFLEGVAAGLDEYGARVRAQVMAELSRRLFDLVGESSIRHYGGRGSLRGWIRLQAVKLAIDFSRVRPRTAEFVEEVEETLAVENDLDYLRDRFRKPFRASFEEAVGRLASNERTYLKMTMIDGLTAAELAKLHRVDHGTATRWIARAREKLVRLTKDILQEKLRAERPEVERIIELVNGRIDLSIERVLAPRSGS
jgi:RNA polymerase sigma-70 factor (ECF subfamily)